MDKTLHDMLNLSYDEENQRRFNDFFEVYRIEYEVETKGLDKKHVYGNVPNRKCRFCGKTPPKVSFEKDAHLIPQFFGNRYLLSGVECDACNEFFSTTYENSFSNYLSADIPSLSSKDSAGYKTPKHTIVQKIFNAFHAEFVIQKTVDNYGEVVFQEELKELIKIDYVNNAITTKTKRKPYVPIYNFKLIVKIALSILPDEEMKNYSNTLRFIMDNKINRNFKELKTIFIYENFIPGAPLFIKPSAFLYTKKPKYKNEPYFSKTFILYSGNHSYQIYIPFANLDQNLVGRNITMIPYPVTIDKKKLEPGLKYKTTGKIMTGCKLTKDEIHNTFFDFLHGKFTNTNNTQTI